MNVQIAGNKKDGFAIYSNQEFSDAQVEWLNAHFKFEASDYGQGSWNFSIEEIEKIELAREYFKNEWGFQVHTSVMNLKAYKEMRKKIEHGLRDNGHCGNCTCIKCKDEYGAVPEPQAGHGDYCQCEECV